MLETVSPFVSPPTRLPWRTRTMDSRSFPPPRHRAAPRQPCLARGLPDWLQVLVVCIQLCYLPGVELGGGRYWRTRSSTESSADMLRYLWLRGGGARVGASSHPADGSRTLDLLVRVAELMLNLGYGQSLVPAPNIVCKYLHRGSNLIPALASKASRVVPDVAILLVQPLGQELPGSQYMHAYTGGGGCWEWENIIPASGRRCSATDRASPH